MEAMITVAAASDCGRKRKDNQDYHAFLPPEEGCRNQKGTLLVLSDGMGGHKGGATASRTAVTVVMEHYYGDARPITEALAQGFHKANAAVYEKSQEDPELTGMGCTLTAVVLKGGWMHWAHVGDSRGYLIHGNTITQFTDDHSFVANLVRAGAISAEEAARRSDHNLLTRAIGIAAAVNVDQSPKPLALKKGDHVLLCCDGLWGVVPDAEILEVVRAGQHPEAICNRLVEKANAAGGPDNITVMVAAITKTHWLARLIHPFMR